MREPYLPTPAQVIRRRRETQDTWTLDITPPVGHGGFAPGQFNMVYAFGVGEIAISISSEPGSTGPLRHTVRAVGPVSRAVAKLNAGDIVGLRGPYGSAWPVEAAAGEDVVLMAGGLGLAPLRPAFYRLLAERERYGRIALLYGTRSPDDILFGRELADWRRRLDLEILVTVDYASPEWRGSVGVVTTLIPRIDFDPANTVAFLCGPEVMMRFGAIALADAGVAEDRLYLSMERNMKCAIGQCGHCQFGPDFMCKDGPVLSYDRLRQWLNVREV